MRDTQYEPRYVWPARRLSMYSTSSVNVYQEARRGVPSPMGIYIGLPYGGVQTRVQGGSPI